MASPLPPHGEQGPATAPFHSSSIPRCVPQTAVLFRSAAHFALTRFAEAASDAQKCVELHPKWKTGYFRQGAALAQCRDYTGSIAAYEHTLRLDPVDKGCKKALAEVKVLAKVL